jgi:hypothetical protein
VLRFSDARNFGRTLTGLLLIVAPAVLLVSSAISPNTDHDNKVQELNAVAAHKGSYLLSGILFLVGGLLVIAMGIGIMRLFRGDGGVTAGQVAGALLVLGGTVTMAWYAFGVMEYEMVNEKGLDRQAMATFLHKSNDAAPLAVLFILFLLGIVIGTIVLAIANWRTRVAPVWVSVAIVLGGVIGAFGSGKGIEIATFVVLFAGLAALGTRVLAMSDEEWGAPRARYRKASAADTSAEPLPAG